jgi:uncharacterized spore protein YtfJ
MSTVETIATLLGSNATARNVFGEAVAVQGRIVVPAARISYGIGGGTGEKQGKSNRSGSGGGGGLIAKPVGFIEITESGAHFVPIRDWRALAAVFCLGLVVGLGVNALRQPRGRDPQQPELNREAAGG